MAMNRAALVAAAAAAAAWGAARQGLDLFHGPGGGVSIHDRNGKLSSRFGAGGGGDDSGLNGTYGVGMGRRPTALLAEGLPVAMDGRGTALPTVVDYPMAEPVTVMAWLLVYSPHPYVNGSLFPPTSPPETALLSFGRPRPYRLNHTASAAPSVTIAPAPGLHLSVGADENFKGHLFFAGAADNWGRLTGFFSRKPFPVNEWVHVALVLEPPPAQAKGRKPPQAVVKGYVDGKLQGRLAIDVSPPPALPPTPPPTNATTTNTTEAETDPHARAVFAWGGVRARGAAMLTGMLQHAAVYAGGAFSDADIQAAREATRPQPVPDDIALGLRLRPPPPPPLPVASNASAPVVAKEGDAEVDVDARATRWLEEAVALLQHEDKGEEQSSRAHWLLSGAVLLGSPPVAAAAAAARELVGTDLTGALTNSSSSQAAAAMGKAPSPLLSRIRGLLARKTAPTAAAVEQEEDQEAVVAAAAASEEKEEDSTTTPTVAPPLLLLPPGAAPRIAQVILAAQATHGLDAPITTSASMSSLLDPAGLHTHGRAVLGAGTGTVVTAGAGASMPIPGDCTVAAAHYLSLAGWAAAHFGVEHRVVQQEGDGDGELMVAVESMVVKPPDEVVLREGAEDGLRRRRGGGRVAAAAAAGEEDDGWSLSLPEAFQYQDRNGNGGGLAGGELEYMRARAEGGGDADALVWYAQTLYWGRHGVQPDRAAAFRLMEQAAAAGHPEAEYNAGIMLLHGEGGVEPDPVRAEALVGRAAAQGFAPALAAQGLWTLQRGVEEEERQRARAAAALREQAEARRAWPAPPSEARDTYLPADEGAAAPAAVVNEAVDAINNNAEPAYIREAEELLRRAVAHGRGHACPEAQAALATLGGWGRVGLGQLQVTGGEAEGDRTRVREIGERLAAAASGGHVRARAGLAAGLWDPIVAFDLSPEEEEDAAASAKPLTVHGSGFGRPAVQLGTGAHALRRSCPAAVGLARPAAEMVLGGVMERALAAYDAGDDGAARRLYGLAAEAGLVSAQINAEALLPSEDSEGLRRRLLQQLALQGWGPAVRKLGRAAEAQGGVEGLLEAIALYHLAGARHGDSRAFYELGALFERLHDERSTPAAAAGTSLLGLLPPGTEPAHVALAYYRQSAYTARGTPHLWPPALAHLFLWTRSEGAARLVALGERWEDAVLLLLGLLLSRVLAAMAARARRRRERRQREQQQEQQRYQQRARVPSSPEGRRPVQRQQVVEGEERGLRLPDTVSASPPPVAASDVADVPVASTRGYDESSMAPREHEEEKAEPKQQPGAATAAACGGP